MALCSMLFATSSNSTLQLRSPDAMRGRVMGLYSTLLVGTTPIGSMLTGFMAEAYGIRLTLAVWGTITLLFVAAGAVYGARKGVLRVPPLFGSGVRRVSAQEEAPAG
jgi:MFS family permease